MRSISCIFITMVLSPIPFSSVWAQKPADRQNNAPQYVIDQTWPQKPDPVKWAQMPGITIDSQDNIYIHTRSRPGVQVYKSDGTFLRSWDIEDVNGAHFIRIGPKGNIWAANITNHTVRKYGPKGKLLLTIGEAGRAGNDELHFNKPTDMAILPTGDIFVTDGYVNRRVAHFDASGKYLNQWGQAGTGPGQFALPHSIVADSHGRLYVADRENARIQVFDTGGRLLAVWENVVTPWGLWISKNDEIWVCGSSCVRKDAADEWLVLPPSDQVVMKLNLKGEILLRLPLTMTVEPPGKAGELNWVHGIALDSHGNMYLGDIQGGRAQKFTLKP